MFNVKIGLLCGRDTRPFAVAKECLSEHEWEEVSCHPNGAGVEAGDVIPLEEVAVRVAMRIVEARASEDSLKLYVVGHGPHYEELAEIVRGIVDDYDSSVELENDSVDIVHRGVSIDPELAAKGFFGKLATTFWDARASTATLGWNTWVARPEDVAAAMEVGVPL